MTYYHYQVLYVIKIYRKPDYNGFVLESVLACINTTAYVNFPSLENLRAHEHVPIMDNIPGYENVLVALDNPFGHRSKTIIAASGESSFALFVGVCGGVECQLEPMISRGDVIIGAEILQYDFGRQLLDRFIRKDTLDHIARRPNTEIRVSLSMSSASRGRMRLDGNTFGFLREFVQEGRFPESPVTPTLPSAQSRTSSTIRPTVTSIKTYRLA